MCKCLGISRQTYYYRLKKVNSEAELEEKIAGIFYQNRKVYGTRKIRKCLANEGLQVSRLRISRLMKRRGLKSTYTVAYYNNYATTCNEALTENVLNREFIQKEPLEAIVTDLTYVKVSGKWHYICLILDLFNREIIGYSCGEHKDKVYY